MYGGLLQCRRWHQTQSIGCFSLNSNIGSVRNITSVTYMGGVLECGRCQACGGSSSGEARGSSSRGELRRCSSARLVEDEDDEDEDDEDGEDCVPSASVLALSLENV